MSAPPGPTNEPGLTTAAPCSSAMRDDRPVADAPAGGTEPVPPVAFREDARAWFRHNRAKLEILAIGAVAIGGIVCMVLATFVIIWRLAGE